MAATNNLLKYASGTSITCSNASLASGSTRESVVVDNSTSTFFDYQVTLTFTLASGSPSTAGPAVNLYAGGSNDGTLWPIIQLSNGSVKATGAGDASVGALGTPANLRWLGTFGLQTTTSSAERTFRTQPFSVARAFDYSLPVKFSVFVENQSGVAFSTSTATTANYLEQAGVYSSSGN